MGLFVDLDDTDAVGTSVGNGTRAKSHNGAATEFGQLRILFRNLFRQKVVRGEPTVIGVDKKGRAV
jgi:hypothetical protein